MSDFATIMAIVAAAAIASPLGGLIALLSKPTTLFMSLAIGFAGGVLLATACFSMLPEALELSSLPVVVAGFCLGLLALYGLDLGIHRGRLAGEEAEQRDQVEHFHRHHHVSSGKVKVLAGGTSIESLIEGVTLGIGAAIKPGLGLLIAIAVMIDNLSETLSIGETIRREQAEHPAKRIFAWTGLIGVVLLASALGSWFFLRDVPAAVLGAVFSFGAGGMFYLTLTSLVPQAEALQYQQSAALAITCGFMLVFVLSQFV